MYVDCKITAIFLAKLSRSDGRGHIFQAIYVHVRIQSTFNSSRNHCHCHWSIVTSRYRINVILNDKRLRGHSWLTEIEMYLSCCLLNLRFHALASCHFFTLTLQFCIRRSYFFVWLQCCVQIFYFLAHFINYLDLIIYFAVRLIFVPYQINFIVP